jgi:hypothetical protein
MTNTLLRATLIVLACVMCTGVPGCRTTQPAPGESAIEHAVRSAHEQWMLAQRSLNAAETILADLLVGEAIPQSVYDEAYDQLILPARASLLEAHTLITIGDVGLFSPVHDHLDTVRALLQHLAAVFRDKEI